MKGEKTMADKKPKNNIKDFKNRMTSPVGFVQTNAKTRKPTKKRGK